MRSLASTSNRLSIAFIVTAPIILVAALVAPLPTLSALATLTFIALSIKWWQFPVSLLLIAAFQTLPSALPTQFALGPITIFAIEPLALLAALRVVPFIRSTKHWLIISLTIAFLASWLALSLLAGRDPQLAISEIRPLITLVLAAFTAFAIRDTLTSRHVGRFAAWVLWSSAVLMVLAVSVNLPVGGRSENATLFLADGGLLEEGGTRLITGSTTAALVAAMILLSLWLVDKLAPRTAWLMVPCAVILLLGLSRNSLLGLGVAAAFSTLCFLPRIRFHILVFKAAGLAAMTALLIWLTSDVLQISAVRNQIAAFDSRILNGLQASTLSADTSVLYRQEETTNLWRAFETSPLVGHGLGFEYQAGTGTEGSFWATKGRSYSHNFWLWLLVKSGIIGLITAVSAALLVIVRHLRRVPIAAVALSAALLGLSAISFVAPQPLGTSSALAFGAIFGMLCSRSEELERFW